MNNRDPENSINPFTKEDAEKTFSFWRQHCVLGEPCGEHSLKQHRGRF